MYKDMLVDLTYMCLQMMTPIKIVLYRLVGHDDDDDSDDDQPNIMNNLVNSLGGMNGLSSMMNNTNKVDSGSDGDQE